MRRRRNIFDSFPETVDLNQGPSFDGLDMTDSDECNSGGLSPTERRLSSNDLSGDLNKSQTFSSWDVGESSSGPNVQNRDSFGTRDSRFRERPFDHHTVVGISGLQNAGSVIEYGGNSSADMEASSSVNSRELINPESSRRYFDRRSTNSSQLSTQQPPSMQVPGMPRNILPFPWSGNVNSRNGIGTSSSSGFTQDNRNDTVRIPNLNSTTHDQQRLNDLPPWTFFPSLETESRGHFRHFPSGPSFASDENVPSFGSRNRPRHHQPILRSLEVHDDDWQPVDADTEGRRMLLSEMRQMLHALRRGENLRAEGYMLFDPFITRVAELHDRHRDMRLDVDNMSYEELLALEERIGDVKTGLTEEVILKSMNQRKHFSFMTISTQNCEPCCICQEEYDNGDDIGSLDCGHDFHTCCIKQWLTQKNICPICKMTGLST